ncbi:MAG: hypothetical protein CL858_29160 [Cupriavidus sp.]|uniref:hypothetical protein n=1 Tax=Methylobacterium sp. TaxID=409 RepID=UPI000C4E0F1E|nr:hypothetical protein [Methylobacterium sp.]MBU69450.1 hypothetical protein [Cupriavidus sp.]
MRLLAGRLRRVACISIVLATSACASPAVLSDRAVDYNETAARAADTQLLLNIARSAFRNPTHYTAISQLRDARSTEGTGGLTGQFPFGADALRAFSLSPSLGLRTSQSPSFDVAPLDTRAAALGLFRPVEPQTFVTYWQQGWARSVLLSMFVDSVTLNGAAVAACRLSSRHLIPDHGAYRVDNAAYRPETFELAQAVFDCLRDNLQVVEQTEVEAALIDVRLSTEEVFKALPNLAKEGFKITEGGTNESRTYTVRKTSKKWNFVLSLGGQTGRAIVTAGTGRPLPDKGSAPSVGMTMRSVDGMVFYLGEIMRNQLENGSLAWIAFSPSRAPRTLFRVEPDVVGNPAERIQVSFLGRDFSVKRVQAGDDASLITLSLVSQLFSQYRENTDLPRTTAVQVVGTP